MRASRRVTRRDPWSAWPVCAKIPHVDKVQLGERLAEARDLAGMTQEGVALAVGLDRTAIVLLEKGERNLKVPELVQIAQVLGRPLSFFVEPPVPAVVSRRKAPHTGHDSTRLLDVELQQIAVDVRGLAGMGLLRAAARPADAHVPHTHDEAERAAVSFRRSLSVGIDPIADLGRSCEVFGLYTLATKLGDTGPDGACVEVETAAGAIGVAVINGDADPGRRRMTLAHELGHWLFGDAYDVGASLDTEKMIDAFAIHFLAPRAGVTKVWSEHPDWRSQDRALAVGAQYRLSWSAAISQLRNLGLISHAERDQLVQQQPRAGDFLRLGLGWAIELDPPYLSPGFVAACLNGYVTSTITQARSLEILRGTLDLAELPRVNPETQDVLRRSFTGHTVPGARA